MTPLLVIVEPNLVEAGGHGTRDPLAIARAAVETGMDVLVLAHEEVDARVREKFDAAQIEMMGVFNLDKGMRTGVRTVDMLGRSRAFIRGLRRAQIEPDRPCIIYTNEGDDEILLGALMHALSTDRAHHHVFQFFGWDGWIRDLSGIRFGEKIAAVRRMIVRATRWTSIFGAEFTLAGQTSAVADAIQREAGVETLALPLPIDWTEYGSMPEGTGEPPRIGYLGDTRVPKGFDLFAEASELVTEPHVLETHALVLTARGKAKQRQEAMVAQLHTDPTNIIHTGLLDDDDFIELLGRLDIVVLPYRASFYAQRGSRIYIEALGMGKVVVTNDRIVLGEHVREHKLGTTFDVESAESLADAMDAALDGFELFSRRAKAFASRVRQRHTAGELVRELREAVESES